MSTIEPCELPTDALLRKYQGRGAYTDCHATEVAWPIGRAEFVEAFYTTGVFKLERLILDWLASRPSTDDEARQLAAGTRDAFAAWTVEEQTAEQLLLRDVSGRTLSWLMVAPVGNGDRVGSTRLYFGSAVIPVVNADTGKTALGFTFRSLLGFHKLYSRVLLRAARSRLVRRHRGMA
jgi:hypothetical protein